MQPPSGLTELYVAGQKETQDKIKMINHVAERKETRDINLIKDVKFEDCKL